MTLPFLILWLQAFRPSNLELARRTARKTRNAFRKITWRVIGLAALAALGAALYGALIGLLFGAHF